MLEEIGRVFRGVKRGQGITLHETEVMDHYGSKEQRQAARRKDTDQDWREVRDEWIEEFGGVGGLTFLDAEGFRYYLPAYMSYWVRKGEEPNDLAYQLQGIDRWPFQELFRPQEKATIARFLEYVRVTFQNEGAAKALRKFWGCYLEPMDSNTETVPEMP